MLVCCYIYSMTAREDILHIHVDPDLKRRIRLACIETGQSISEWVIAAIAERLKSQPKKS